MRSGLRNRIAVALGSAMAALVTLLAWAAILVAIGARADLGIVPFIGMVVFSKAGVLLVALAALAGFLLGGERMAEIFSVLWGTHPRWKSLGAWLGERFDALDREVPVPIWAAMLGLLLLFAWVFVIA